MIKKTIFIYGDSRNEEWAVHRILEMNQPEKWYVFDFGYEQQHLKEFYRQFTTIYHTTDHINEVTLSLRQTALRQQPPPVTLMFLGLSPQLFISKKPQWRLVSKLVKLAIPLNATIFIGVEQLLDVPPDIRMQCDITFAR